jgi:hypothetical protein
MNDKQLGLLHGKNNIETVVKTQREKELRLLNSVKPHSGHQCFELNCETYIIQVASYMTEQVKYQDLLVNGYSAKKKVQVKPNHIYTTALNKKNAAKYFARMLGWSEYDFDKNTSKISKK